MQVGLSPPGHPHTRITTCRHTPQGYVRTTYSSDEIDAVAIYSPDTDRCYLLPIADVERRSAISLRLALTANNQSRNVRWAIDYEIGRTLEHLCATNARTQAPVAEMQAIR
jgi:PD-(D/E)XK endonuclease